MKLKELRKSKKQTQTDLAKVFNVSTQTILNWENEIFSPNVKQLIEIADYFEVSIDYLLDHKTSSSFDKFDHMSEDELRKLLKDIFQSINK